MYYTCQYFITYRQRVLNGLYVEDQAFPLSLSPVIKLDRDTQEKWERETTFWREIGEGGGWGAKNTNS